MTRSRLRYFGHVLRLDDPSSLKEIMLHTEPRGEGVAHRKTWDNCIREDLASRDVGYFRISLLR